MKKNDGNAYLDGGHVRGPGTDTSDSIPANLSNGEFVVNATIVKRPGMLDFLKKLNAGDTGIHQHVERQNPKPPKTKHLATGGYFSNGGLATDNDMQSLMDAKNDPSVQQDPALIDPNARHPDDLAIGMPKQAPSSQDDNTPPQDPRLTAALAQQNKQQSLADLLKGFQTLASARAIGYGAKPDYSAVDTLNKQASQPVEQYNNQLNQENTLKKLKEAADEHKAKMDEFQVNLAKSNLDLTNDKDNSATTGPIADLVRSRVKQKLEETGQPINDDTLNQLSAKQLFNMMPSLHQDAVNVLQDRKLTEEIKSREAMAHEANQTKKDIQDQRSQDRSDMASDKQDTKDEENDNKDVMKLNDHLMKPWVARGGNAGKVEGKIVSAEAADQLIKQGQTQVGGLDSRQVEELAQNTAQLLGNNNAASARVEALVPHTWLGKAQTLHEWLDGKPHGQEMQEFVQRLADTSDRERKLAIDQKRQYQIEGLPSFARLKKHNPDLYNARLQSAGIDPSMIDEKGQYKKAGSDSVQVRDPKGNIREVPKSQLKDALDPNVGGGTLVNPGQQGQ